MVNTAQGVMGFLRICNCPVNSGHICNSVRVLNLGTVRHRFRTSDIILTLLSVLPSG